MVEQSPVKLTGKFHDVHGVSASVLVGGSSWWHVWNSTKAVLGAEREERALVVYVVKWWGMLPVLGVCKHKHLHEAVACYLFFSYNSVALYSMLPCAFVSQKHLWDTQVSMFMITGVNW